MLLRNHRIEGSDGSFAGLAAALMCLKNKKLYESQLEQVETNMLRVNEQKIMLENQRTTMETVSALQTSAETSKQTMKEMKIGKVDQIFDEINEQNEQMREIQDALGQSLGMSHLLSLPRNTRPLIVFYAIVSVCCSSDALAGVTQVQLQTWTRMS